MPDKAMFQQIGATGETFVLSRALADETPIAIEFNGMGYAVLMASPSNLEDLVYGFALSDRLIDDQSDVLDMNGVERENGILLRVNLASGCAERVLERVRHRVSESSCGLCGIENLEQALRPLPKVTARTSADADAVFRALRDIADHQPLNAWTGAVHAAAFCGPDGEVCMVREDVGRHNALDKLVGAMMRAGQLWDGGFALVTSRCSFEMVEKAVLAGCPMLAAISAPTKLAVERAQSAGLRLIALARPDSLLLAMPSSDGPRNSLGLRNAATV